jgi:hypothetical protein
MRRKPILTMLGTMCGGKHHTGTAPRFVNSTPSEHFLPISLMYTISGPAAEAKGPLSRDPKEDRGRHLAGLLLNGFQCPAGPDAMRASPPQDYSGLTGHVAKPRLEKPG